MQLPIAHSDAAQPGLLKQEFIFESASFPECHASTIVETSNHLVAAWFGGTREKNPDVGIWVSRLVGDSWTKPQEAVNGKQSNGPQQPCWNPVLFQPRTGPLILFYKVGPNPDRWWGMFLTSIAGGTSWSAPRALPTNIFGPIKNKPIQLGNDILCPSSTEAHGWQIHFERTDSTLAHWESTGPVNDLKEFSAIQPTILQHSPTKLQALGRTRQGKIFQIWSEDAGKHWGPMSALSLPNPNSGIDAVTLADHRHLLVYNHTSRGRSPLNVAISADGKEWQSALVLEDTPGEYSYPAVIQGSDGLVHATYTWKRQRIKHVVIDPAKLELQPVRGEK
jgi:predicted neuraminidase